jgi:hypothetical protein
MYCKQRTCAIPKCLDATLTKNTGGGEVLLLNIVPGP